MSQATSPSRQLVIIDSQVNGWQSLASDVGTDNLVLILDSSSDGLTQISDYLTTLSANAGTEDFAPLQSIHIISHGSAGSLLLGSSTLTTSNLSLYSGQLASLGNALSEKGDILLYGCNVAQGEAGNQFIQALAQVTGADVAASDDLTGDSKQGGDWVLEASTGGIEADIAVSSDAQQNYNHVLGKPSDYELAQMSNLAYSDNPSFAGWDVKTYNSDFLVGFFAAQFQKGKDIVIAFRGTDNAVDLATADKAIIGLGFPFPNWDTQFAYAINTANKIRLANPDAHIYVTGHSLGGALAQVTSQMFGFEGATFDPGGAQNIVNSAEFSIKASVIGIEPVGVPSNFTNYTVNDSIVSGWSGDMVGKNNISLENQTMQDFFRSDSWLDVNHILGPLKQYFLHSMDGIETLMLEAQTNEIVILTQKRDAWNDQAQNGDIGVSNQPVGQGTLDFYGTEGNNYLYANNNDNIIYGYAGNDTIFSFAGNDTVYAGDGDDTVSTAQGNDVIDAGGGSDTVYSDALQLTLDNGSVINVFAANAFTYEVGGNSSAGINQADASFASFALNTLGVALPTGNTIVSGGAVVIGGGLPNALNDVGGIVVQPNASLINFGADANGDAITLGLVGVFEPSLVSVAVV